MADGTIDEEQEQRWARRIEHGDVGARNLLILAHVRLMRGLARRLAGPTIDRDEAECIAGLAMSEAADRFRPGTGPFAGHAVRAIRVAFRSQLRREMGWKARWARSHVEDRSDPGCTTDPAESVRGAMATLTEDERAAIRGRYRMAGVRSGGDRAARVRRRAERKLRDVLTG